MNVQNDMDLRYWFTQFWKLRSATIAHLSQWPRRADAVVQRPGGWTTDGVDSTQSLEA